MLDRLEQVQIILVLPVRAEHVAAETVGFTMAALTRGWGQQTQFFRMVLMVRLMFVALVVVAVGRVAAQTLSMVLLVAAAEEEMPVTLAGRATQAPRLAHLHLIVNL
jgi:hypothetical protein